MNYPNDFDTPTFPAGKSIAFSRSVAVWIGIVFFCIVVACGLVLLFNKSKRNYPFLISTDPLTSEWTVIAYPEKDIKITQDNIIQETLVRNYVVHWFSIDKNDSINESRWQRCEPSDCEAPDQYVPNNYKCTLFCSSDTDLFRKFQDDILPEYHDRINQASEVINVRSQLITPPALKSDKKDICESGKTELWQSYITLESSVNNLFNVLAFVEIGCEPKTHPATLGYYIKDFNSYRIIVQGY